MAPQRTTLSLKSNSPSLWLLYELACAKPRIWDMRRNFQRTLGNFFPLKKKSQGKMVSFFLGTFCVLLRCLESAAATSFCPEVFYPKWKANPEKGRAEDGKSEGPWWHNQATGSTNFGACLISGLFVIWDNKFPYLLISRFGVTVS